MVGTITIVRDAGKNVDVLPEMEGLEAVPMSASAVEKWFAVSLLSVAASCVEYVSPCHFPLSRNGLR